MAISMIATLLKRVGAVCLAFVIYWHASGHGKPLQGRAIVHVVVPDVSLFVDHHEYAIPSLAESPVVCELPPGVHRAQIRHRGALLAEEKFVVQAGREVVIHPTIRSPAPATRAGAAGGEVPKPEPSGAGGLATVLTQTMPLTRVAATAN